MKKDTITKLPGLSSSFIYAVMAVGQDPWPDGKSIIFTISPAKIPRPFV